MKILFLLSALVAIDGAPTVSFLAGNVIQSYISATPQVQTVVVKSQPAAVSYAAVLPQAVVPALPQPLVVRPYAGDTVVVEAKPTVVYDKPKRIIYRKTTCYSDNCDTTSSVSSGGSSRSFSSGSSTSSFTPTLNSRPLNDFEDDDTEGQIGSGNTIQGGGGQSVKAATPRPRRRPRPRRPNRGQAPESVAKKPQKMIVVGREKVTSMS